MDCRSRSVPCRRASGGKGKADAGSISIEAMNSIELKAGASSIIMKKDGTITIQGLKITVKADAQMQLKAAMTQVNGDGMLTLKGGVTMIN